MFAVFQAGGMRSPYVLGAVRQRNVEKISKASVLGTVGQKDDPAIFPKNTDGSSLQARLFIFSYFLSKLSVSH